MGKLLKHFIEDMEIEYEKHPRIIIFAIIIFFYLLILVQSYFASPRGAATVFLDTWELLIFLVPLSVVVLRLKVRNLLIFGIFYFILGLGVGFLGFTLIKIEYATLSFLFGIWMTGDWLNYRKFRKSLLSELLSGNYYLAFGLFLSTVVLGSVVEFLNAPGGLWLYSWPFPSITIFGVPVFLAAFGWFPWILAMLVFLYPFALRRPKKL